MTLTTTVVRNDYPATGTTGPFAFTFRIFEATDLVVLVRDAAGTETVLSYPADYTVSGVGNTSGGSVTTTAAVASGATLTILRATPVTQTTDIKNQGAFFPKTHEDAFDRMVAGTQQIKELAERALHLPRSIDAADFDTELPYPEAGKALAINGDADGLTYLDTTPIESLGALPSAGEADLLTTAVTHLFTSSVSKALRIDRLAGWIARRFGYYIVTDPKYGAVGDGVTNDTVAILAAIADAEDAGGGVVYVPPVAPGACYLVGGASSASATAALEIANHNVVLMGAAGNTDYYGGQFGGSALKLAAGSNRSLLAINTTLQGCGVRHLALDGNKASQTAGTSHGLYLRGTAATYADSRHLLYDVFVSNCRNHGVFAEDDCSAGRAQFVHVRQCDGDGIRSQGSDWKWLSCEAGSNAGSGLVIQDAFNVVHGGAYFSNGDYNVHLQSSSSSCVLRDLDLDRAGLDNLLIEGNGHVVDLTSRDPGQDTTATYSHIRIASGCSGLDVRARFAPREATNTALYLIRCEGPITYSALDATRYDTTAASNGVLLFGGVGTGCVVRRRPGTITFTANDTTPSVSGSGSFADATVFATANTGATSITTFDDGVDGQQITLLINDANTTLVDGATLQLAGSVNATPAALTTFRFVNISGTWRELSRSVN